jgi:prepilin peptidase CpaA
VIIVDAIICSVSGLAAFFDYRFRRIPNWLIVIGLLSGLIINGYLGSGPLMQSILGFVIGIAVLIVPFAFGWIGAGDVKYLGVVGALLGAGWLPRVFFYSALAAGVIAVFYLAMGVVRAPRFREYWNDIKLVFLSLGKVRPKLALTPGGRGGVPWGVAFAAGTIFAYYVDHTGSWAGF